MKKLLVICAVVLLCGSAHAYVLYDSDGFEPGAGFLLGPLPSQDGWLPDSTLGQSSPMVVNDPTGLLSGQVVEFDAINGLGGYCGAYVPFFGDPRWPGYTIHVEWDQVRVDRDDDFRHLPDFATRTQFGIQWGQDGLLHADEYGAPAGPVTPGIVDHIYLMYFGPPGGGSVELWINGVLFGSGPTAGGTPHFTDWVFEMEDTPFGISHGPLYMDNFRITVIIPEPGVFALGGLGLLALLGLRRKKK
jgi:hypothetical protein